MTLLKVTRKNIDDYISNWKVTGNILTECPIARAFHDLFPKESFTVGLSTISIWKDREVQKVIDLPDIAQDFISRAYIWNNPSKLQPIEFEINYP